jgi:simple sugar transport system permease protein
MDAFTAKCSAPNDNYYHPGCGDPNGDFGKVLRLFLSLVLLQIISTGFNLLGISPHLTEAIWGTTMILAIALALVRDRWMARLWLRRSSK